jgi:hypothetical protein
MCNACVEHILFQLGLKVVLKFHNPHEVAVWRLTMRTTNRYVQTVVCNGVEQMR